MLVRQCHKPLIWQWFVPPIYGDLGIGLLFVFTTLRSIIIPL